MRYKAKFLKVPIWFDDKTNFIGPRYGLINELILNLAFGLWRVASFFYIGEQELKYPIEIKRSEYEKGGK